MDLLYWLANEIVRFMDQGPSLLPFLLYVAIVGIPVTLLHELGHAVVASRRLDGPVEVTVGGAGKLAEFQLGRVRAHLNVLARDGGVAGSAEFDASRATARDVLWIALAGPAASALGAVVTAMLLASAPEAGVVHDALWTATLAGAFGVLNLVPFDLQERRDGPAFRSDGRLALDALRVVRELA